MGLSGRVFHAPFLKGCGLFEVLSVCERSSNLTKDIFPRASVVRTFDAVLADSRIELIIVNTPDEYHYTMARSALLAGKHVIVEKPFVPEMRQAEELVDIAARKSLCLTVYQNRRFDGDFLTLQKLLESGFLGDVLEYESRIEMWRPVVPSAWREESGRYHGVLYNLGSHLIDQALLLFGRPETVQAVLHRLRPETGIADFFRLHLGYPSRVVAVQASYAAHGNLQRFRVQGSAAAWLKYGPDGQETRIRAEYDDRFTAAPTTQERSLLIRGTPPSEVYENVALLPGDYGMFYSRLFRAIREGADPPVTIPEMLLGVELTEAAVRSACEGRNIRLERNSKEGAR